MVVVVVVDTGAAEFFDLGFLLTFARAILPQLRGQHRNESRIVKSESGR